MTPRLAPRRISGLLLVLIAAGALGAAALPTERATADLGSFSAEASGSPLDVTISNPQSLPLGLTIEAGGPIGQSDLTSYGQSLALAAFPNPGPDVAGLPGLAQSSGAPVPSDPLYVTASNGQPPQHVSDPGVTLDVHAGPTASSGSAAAGASGGPVTLGQASTTQQSDGSVAAQSIARADAIVVAGTMTLRGLDSSASATRNSDGTLVTESHLAIADLEVGGQKFGFEDGSFSIPGTSVPVPANTALSALAGAGINAVYQQPQRTADGIIGGDLRLSFALPGAPIGVTGPTVVTYMLGAVDASVGFGAGGPGGTGVSMPEATGLGATPSGGAPNTGAPAAVSSLAAAAPEGPVGSAATPALSQAFGSPASALKGSSSGAPVPAARVFRTASAAQVYLIIVVAAIAALGAAQAVRILGARLRWN